MAENPPGPDIHDLQLFLGVLAPPEGPGELGRLGSYRIVEVLGSGAMAVVFRAEDMRLRREVALKVLKPAVAAGNVSRQRFLREAQATAALDHDHIIAVHQVDEDRGLPFLAMPLLKGETLHQRLRRQKEVAPPWLAPAEVLQIGREIAEGLAAAHERGLIHRDIKPANIFLVNTGGPTGKVKLLDFGMVRVADEHQRFTQSGAIVGTPAFMAPEQALGGQVDGRCDLFSLGCVLYRMGTGQLAFNGASAAAILHAVKNKEPAPALDLNPALPPALGGLIGQLLAKDREKRPASAQEVVAGLRAIEVGERERQQTVGGESDSATKSAEVRSETIPSRSRPGCRGLAVGGILAGFGVYWWFFRG